MIESGGHRVADVVSRSLGFFERHPERDRSGDRPWIAPDLGAVPVQ